MVPGVSVEISFFDVNLELYFSSSPFEDFNKFSSNMRPNRRTVIPAGESREERFARPKDLRDCLIQIYEKNGEGKKKKIDSFLWVNPEVRALINEDKGTAQVFLKGSKLAGCYCKVFQMKNGSSKFYRDGYTDITGTFKYALADL